MKNIVRVIVGVLFIFSGLVKANDPIGLSYKMQEFFDVWGMSFLNNYSLAFAVIMNAFEIVAGAALLLGWKPKLINWLLLLLIVFFTFLTGYAYLSGKFKSCGCFGDCIPITSGVSFIKDLILLTLIIFLFFNTKYIQPAFKKSATIILLLLVTAFSFAAQYYTLLYLPVKDCLPYKVGNNIKEQMKMPVNAIPDSTVINFVYEKDGKQLEFTAEDFPEDFNDSTYKFIDRYDRVVKPGVNNNVPIKNFSLIDGVGTDLSSTVLDEKNILVLFIEDTTRPMAQWQKPFEELYKKANEKHVPIFAVTSTKAATVKAFGKTTFSNINILEGDRVMIRTAARTNPTVYLLQNGTIAGKWSFKNFYKAVKFIDELTIVPEVKKPAREDLISKDTVHH